MSYTPPIDPRTIHPRGDLILCTRYERPDVVGSIHIPAAYRQDATWCWWEVVRAGPEVRQALGMPLQYGDIIRTPFRPGIDSGYEDGQGRRLFFISVEHNQVNAIIPNTWSPEETL